MYRTTSTRPATEAGGSDHREGEPVHASVLVWRVSCSSTCFSSVSHSNTPFFFSSHAWQKLEDTVLSPLYPTISHPRSSPRSKSSSSPSTIPLNSTPSSPSLSPSVTPRTLSSPPSSPTPSSVHSLAASPRALTTSMPSSNLLFPSQLSRKPSLLTSSPRRGWRGRWLPSRPSCDSTTFKRSNKHGRKQPRFWPRW